MDEQEKTKETEKEEATEDTDKGDKPETTPVIETARVEREKLEVATEALRKENDRRERLLAQQALGGKTAAGEGQEMKKEETPREYSGRLMRGEVKLT